MRNFPLFSSFFLATAPNNGSETENNFVSTLHYWGGRGWFNPNVEIPFFFLKTSLSLAALRGSDVDKYSEGEKEDKNEN